MAILKDSDLIRNGIASPKVVKGHDESTVLKQDKVSAKEP